MEFKTFSYSRYLRLLFASCVAGLFSGVLSGFFLILLEIATQTRKAHLSIIFILPFAGFLIGALYLYFGKESVRGNNLILDEIHNPQKVVPFRLVPLVMLTTIITHLFGGSAGREGTAVQMGGAISDQLTKIFSLTMHERRMILCAGMGAGFGSAIGAPIAGVIFGMEVLFVGKFNYESFLPSAFASFFAFLAIYLLPVHHTIYPVIEIPPFEFLSLFFMAIAGIFFGLSAFGFSHLTHKMEKVFSKFISYSPFRPFVGAIVLLAFYHLDSTFRYMGLGLDIIQEAIAHRSSYEEPLLKGLFTSLTLSSGLKGGEFTPLVFIGATLGSALSSIIPLSISLLAASGFAAVFAGASNTPIACSVLACELFGVSIAPYAFVACFVSYYCSGHSGIYKSQIIHKKKNSVIKSAFLSFKNSKVND